MLEIKENRIYSVACPYCDKSSGEDCVTSGGNVREQPHRKRTKRYLNRSAIKVVEVVKQDGPLEPGERFFARKYWLDPEKGTILGRIADGFDPNRNFYWRGDKVKVVGWVEREIYKSWINGENR